MFLAMIHIFIFGFLSFAGYQNSNAPSPLSPHSEAPEPFGKSIYSATPGNRPGVSNSPSSAQASVPSAQRVKAEGKTKSGGAVAKKGGGAKPVKAYAKSPISHGAPNRKISSQPRALPAKKKISK